MVIPILTLEPELVLLLVLEPMLMLVLVVVITGKRF